LKNQTTMVVNSVGELRRNYTEKELKRIEEARRLYVIMGRPSKADFFGMITKGKLLDNPVTVTDYNNAEKIHGTDLGVIKGKTVRVKRKHVSIDVETAVKGKLNIILAVDVMHFTNLNFLVTVSRNLHFITATILPDRRKKIIVQALTQVLNVYKGKGHTVSQTNFTEQNAPVHNILADNKFESIREHMEALGVGVNVTAKEEHVPEID
jgi:hypothetical protein